MRSKGYRLPPFSFEGSFEGIPPSLRIHVSLLRIGYQDCHPSPLWGESDHNCNKYPSPDPLAFMGQKGHR